ncbi:TATA element modulatory factor isoform X2 [Pectinophora gossypiella]|uniref:TATA element modulatory factor isoform X2 n=1 Tax=Pectinophora gossypiella TaxID=13191 RepID=UPI00214EDED6|nr:TATA element modulatory factor isoform X2 [Pectinophora gossypiella]
MNWFDTSGLTSLAKTALKEAQKTIDKALDIQDESSDDQEEASPTHSKDSKYGSQDDLFSKSQLVMSDGEGAEFVNVKCHKLDERRSSSRSNRLSLVSSQNSSDSVEVLSQSMKTTPDSPSVQSISHSSSIGPKHNSESVEILPDSLISPSSIECLGFDSYSSPSSNLSPDTSEKPTPVGDKTERIETADSVSLVADDDEDTMSYNSVSECTAPTVLDTDEKPGGPFPKPIRMEPQRKGVEKEFIHLEHPLIPQKMQLSENSSNDGSWSDRTLNADNDSVILDVAAEEQKKDVDHEDALMEKLSDSSSFYNVNVSSTDMIRSESSAFVNVEKQQCGASHSSNSSQKDGSVKERVSPISSDSKSDLVKIGSDRTSGHTSGDELETATSSDIEIIPSPNGDNHGFCRSSPAKYAFKQGKFDGTTSPNLVDLVLGKSLATKIRGHNRELSEASVQSNTSDESQGSENDRLMRRLCEMAEILEARENRLMEVSRSNAELAENNADLKSQVETLMMKHEGGDINMITEDYTQRMSALEKKFQQAIREKDQLRKQLDTLKAESTSRKNSSELENALKEKDEAIAGLQEEGEKLARQQLQHSNIIKKLRAKEKDNEQVIKNLRDKIAEQTNELDRLKRSMAAKEELEVNQIEAVYRLTTANKKLETELMETKSALDDTSQKLESTKTSLDACRRELNELQRNSSELSRRRGAQQQLEADKQRAEDENLRLRAELQGLRAELQQEERRWISREEALRRELTEARELCSSLEAREGAEAGEAGAAALLQQLAALQRSALDREHAHSITTRNLAQQLAEAETCAAKAVERERVAREENQTLAERLVACEGLLHDAQARAGDLAERAQRALHAAAQLDDRLDSQSRELDRLKSEHASQVSALQARVSELEQQLAAEREALHVEKKRNSILQEQMTSRGDISPPHSVVSDSFSGSLWAAEDGTLTPTATAAAGPGSALCVEEALSQLSRRSGELRAAAHTVAQLRAQRDAALAQLAALHAELDELRAVQEQYDALLQMYGEKEEQLEEVKLDLQDVTQLYKAQLDELIALKQRA